MLLDNLKRQGQCLQHSRIIRKTYEEVDGNIVNLVLVTSQDPDSSESIQSIVVNKEQICYLFPIDVVKALHITIMDTMLCL